MIKVCNFQALIDSNYTNTQIKKSPQKPQYPNAVDTNNTAANGIRNFDVNALLESDSYLKQQNPVHGSAMLELAGFNCDQKALSQEQEQPQDFGNSSRGGNTEDCSVQKQQQQQQIVVISNHNCGNDSSNSG